ncbi:hypothetical protein V490_02388 [Pseudogymnoascus sp. VKM F-3557]|nr:hypothetical protein V490_02388 [Pseudogymnoascus sp. VKM F-3557]
MYPDNWEVVFPAKKLKRIHHFGSVPEYANIPGRVTINDLPPELVINIARNVANSIINSGYVSDRYQNEEEKDSLSLKKDFSLYNSRSLLQLGLCSRHFHRLVVPVLYERFHYNAQASTKGFVLFLIRILTRPDLGRWIKIFHVDGAQAPGLGMVLDRGDEFDCDPYRGTLDVIYKSDFDVRWFKVEDLQATRKKIAEVCATARDCYEWAMLVEKGDLNAMIALVLTLAPNLQVLDIDMWTYPRPLPSIITQILGQSGRLQRERQLEHPLAFFGLKNVVVRYYYDTDMKHTIHHLISLLMIPSVESLCVTDQSAAIHDFYPSVETDVDEDSLGAALQDTELELTNMKELSLSFTAIRPKPLFQLWRCCPNLKRLCYRDRFGEDYEEWMDLSELRSINLMATVSCLNPYLQDLTICNEGYVWSSTVDRSVEPLAPLECVRRLHTTWETFLCRGDINYEANYYPPIQNLVDAIPKSLELLHIEGGIGIVDTTGEVALAVILKLLDQRHRFQALKTLDFGWKSRCPNGRSKRDWNYHPGFTHEGYRKVIARCQKAGIELILEALTPSPKYVYCRMDDDGKMTASGTNQVKHIVHYPYDDYERICSENECDPETGRPYELEEISDIDW